MGADLPAGVLLDCDGTLADTEPISARAWREVLAGYGVEVTDADHRAIIGHAWPRGYHHFSARADLGDPDEFRAHLRAHAVQLHDAHLRLFPDTVATVHALVAADVPIAVASSSSHAHVLRCLDRGGIRHLVAAVVGADDVVDHKPHPAPYLAAADAIGVPASRCTAVEDTPTGVASARAAGAFTVAVARGIVDPAGLVGADRVVDHVHLDALTPPPGWVSSAA